MSTFKKATVLLFSVAAAAGLVLGIRIEAARSLQKITVGHDTTCILAPLRPDGTPDYIAALNACTSKGVTHANNAAVPLLLLSGTEYTAELWKQIATALDAPELESPPAPAARFIPFTEFVTRFDEPPAGALASEKWFDKWDAEEKAVESQPWSEADHLEAAAWLRAMNGPLDQAVRAAAMTQYYTPLLRRSERTTVMTAASLEFPRLCVKGLAARAMRRVNAGDRTGARGDALAALRLATLPGRQPVFIEQLPALSAMDEAAALYKAFLQDPAWSSGDIAAMRLETAGLWKPPSAQAALDIGMRFEILDTFTQIARYGPEDGTGAEVEIDGRPAGPPVPAGPFAFGMLPVHFDPILRTVNQTMDALVKAAAMPGAIDRQREAERIDAGLASRIAALGSPNTAQGRMNLLALQLCAGRSRTLRLYALAEQRLTLLQAALAAREYFSSHPYNEADAAALAKALPLDPFTNQPFAITRDGGRLALSASQPPPSFGQQTVTSVTFPLH